MFGRGSVVTPLLILMGTLRAGGALAHMPIERVDVRRTTAAQLTVPLERLVLSNGLVVLMAPVADARSVVVLQAFRAGGAFEPPGRSGLAHLVEHVVYRGPTADTDYEALLRGRGAMELGATTSRHAMTFVAAVPPAELPLAVWVAADRLGHLPGLLGQVDLELHKKVVLAERALRVVDREFGLVDEVLERQLYADAHPLHRGLVGTRETLGPVTVDDVRRFVGELLVPANGVLVVAGRFERAQLEPLLTAYLAGLPAGTRAPDPSLPRRREAAALEARERLSRQPRVTFAWQLTGQRPEALETLAQGALLLTLSTDGAFGTRVRAAVDRYASEAMFRMDVVLPYQKPRDAALGEAEAFLRYLTLIDMDLDLMDATNLYQDREALSALDGVGSRARLLAQLELAGYDVTRLGSALERHWRIDRPSIQETARQLLKQGRVVVYAQPERPRQPRLEREE